MEKRELQRNGVFKLQTINEHYKDSIEREVTYNNYNRIGKLSLILFLGSFVLVLIDRINWAKGLWIITNGYRYLFFAHVVFGLVSLFYFLVFYKIKIRFPNEVTYFHEFYGVSFAFIMLSLTAVISGFIDQQIHGEITVYILGCLTIAVMFNYNLKVTSSLYGLSWVMVMAFLTISQKDLNIRQGNYINASSIIIIAFFLATTLYKFKRCELIHNYYLETLVAERTKELQTANELLSQEITERKRAEVEMVRMDRLNLIGQMAASISHEVRNPMTTVKGFLQLLKSKQELKDQEYFDLMIEELDRANSILSEFLSISKTKSKTLERCNINDIVNYTLPLIQADAQYNDKLLILELNNVPYLQLDAQEIRQLLLNLVRNGFEAMESGGQLKIITYSANDEVVLAVTDEGKGIEQSVLEKLGTPFFTTKEQGTGLGLAVCHGIVSRNNGRISVETSPKGTTFYVYFKSS
ncbi:sporulation kinase A [Desulfosporosinus acididurans]|uniref:histidine kinase n=1 Tax=Desulfosporosinus acididurans TaxID=476652 RepID=A0A0J1FRY1_9FIRM|nr:ATP-binding protein [Desulfosporosinus acididurans]KLU66239.1 sporulation kinase A [Desulfosporosinus acididurans]